MSDREDEVPEPELEPEFDEEEPVEEEDLEAKRQAAEEAELSEEEEHYTITKKPAKPKEKVRKPPLRPNSYSIYTYSRVLRERAQEIARNSPVYTTFDPTRVISPMEIAIKELRERRLPYAEVISRPDGQIDLIPLWQKNVRPPK
jgi:hypothetical protein